MQERERSSVAATIAAYSPVSVSPEAAVFARAVVAKVHPESRERAKALLHASSRLASFGCSLGLELDPDVLFEDVGDRALRLLLDDASSRLVSPHAALEPALSGPSCALCGATGAGGLATQPCQGPLQHGCR